MLNNNIQNIESIRSLSQILRIPTFRKIIKVGYDENSNKRIKKHFLPKKNIDTYYTNKKFIKELYSILKNNYRNEYLIKNEILNNLILKKYKLSTSFILNEFKISKSIADLLLINGEVKLFEIKTNLDNLDRLAIQLNEYRKAVEKIYIVSDTKNIDKIYNKFKNDNYGIVLFTKENKITTIKSAKVDKSFFDTVTLFKLLHKEEYTKIIKENFQIIPNVSNVDYFKTYLSFALKLKPVDFQKQVFKIIKKRNINNLNYLLSKQTPYELKYICYVLKLTDNEYKKLYNFLNKPL